MELPEKLEDINYWLQRDYGDTGARPNWRVVFSDDQFEMVKGWFCTYDNSGNFISATKGVSQVRKYEYIRERYVLERIMPVPMLQREELVGSEWSYEPVFTFEDIKSEYLPPLYHVCKIVIENVMKAAARAVGARYKNPEDDQDPIEVKHERIKKLQEELFGNETEVTDAFSVKEAISVPHNYGE